MAAMVLLNCSFLVIGLVVLVSHGVSANYLTERQVSEQLKKYATKTQSPADVAEFQRIIDILTFPEYIYRKSVSSYSSSRLSASCLVCRSTIQVIMDMFMEGSDPQNVTEVVVDLCTLMEIQPAQVCRGVVTLNAPIVIYILENQPNFSAEGFCGVLLQSDDKTSCPYNEDLYDWSVNIPPKTGTNDPPVASNSTLKIAHISDIHYDPIYEYKSLARCNEPTCCRKGQIERASPKWSTVDDENEHPVIRSDDGSYLLDLDHITKRKVIEPLEQYVEKDIPESDQAGYWGDYRNCDAPWWAVEDCVSKIVETHNNLDYVYYTGDIIDHGVWETTEAGNRESIKKTFQLLEDTFGDTPLYPVIGNHESQPLNLYAPPSVTDPELSTAWLYDLLAEEWSRWLPAETADTIKIGGYYTTLARPGLRIVVLNSNLCYRYNWWLQLEPKDPSGQLQWLVGVLTQAEADNEIVHILSHIPPGIADLIAVCTREYKRVIERFAGIIAGEFNGHTHNDEFKIFYAKSDNQPVAVAWNGGSVTTYSNVNPNYRVYDVDSGTYAVTDIETYVYNITEANLTPEVRPRWYKEYSFKEAYGLSSISLASLDNLLQRMVTSEKSLLVHDYHIFRGKDSDPFNNNVCNSGCARGNLRYISITELYDEKKFDTLWNTFQIESNQTKN